MKKLVILGYLVYLALMVIAFASLAKADVVTSDAVVDSNAVDSSAVVVEETRPLTIDDLKEAFNDGVRKSNQDQLVLNMVTLLGAIFGVYLLVSPIIIKAKKTNLNVETSNTKIENNSKDIVKTINKTM